MVNRRGQCRYKQHDDSPIMGGLAKVVLSRLSSTDEMGELCVIKKFSCWVAALASN